VGRYTSYASRWRETGTLELLQEALGVGLAAVHRPPSTVDRCCFMYNMRARGLMIYFFFSSRADSCGSEEKENVFLAGGCGFALPCPSLPSPPLPLVRSMIATCGFSAAESGMRVCNGLGVASEIARHKKGLGLSY